MRASGRSKIIRLYLIDLLLIRHLQTWRKIDAKLMSKVVVLESFSILVAFLVDLFVVFDDILINVVFFM